MAQLATPQRLASYLQMDLDASTANVALDGASATFEREADTKFSSTTHVHTVEGVGQQCISLPRQPVIAVQSLTVDGVTLAAGTDFVRIGPNIYRLVGFGGFTVYPAVVVVTYTYGYVAVPNDVELAVLEIAGGVYQNPTRVVSEQIDDYSVRYQAGTAIEPGPDWRVIAASYRVGAVA
jgi:hypothetical protein